MARKPEARRPAGKDRDEPVKPQIERFKDAARQAGADETGETFERAFRKIVQPQRRSPQ